jgi:hypothetical protein
MCSQHHAPAVFHAKIPKYSLDRETGGPKGRTQWRRQILVSLPLLGSEPTLSSIYQGILHVVQIGFGAHPVSYTMGTGGLFPGGKAAGA